MDYEDQTMEEKGFFPTFSFVMLRINGAAEKRCCFCDFCVLIPIMFSS
jgi:hypothetical protein